MTLAELGARLRTEGIAALNLMGVKEGWQASTRSVNGSGWVVGRGATISEAIEDALKPMPSAAPKASVMPNIFD